MIHPLPRDQLTGKHSLCTARELPNLVRAPSALVASAQRQKPQPWSGSTTMRHVAKTHATPAMIVCGPTCEESLQTTSGLFHAVGVLALGLQNPHQETTHGPEIRELPARLQRLCRRLRQLCHCLLEGVRYRGDGRMHTLGSGLRRDLQACGWLHGSRQHARTGCLQILRGAL